MSTADVRGVVLGVFDSKPILQNLLGDQDFFDAGASSLTVIDMQLLIEEKLGFNVPTSHLMANPTLNAWISAYSEQQGECRVPEPA